MRWLDDITYAMDMNLRRWGTEPRVKIKKLESFVENMGVKLKDEELEELMTQLSADGECQTSLCSSEKH